MDSDNICLTISVLAAAVIIVTVCTCALRGGRGGAASSTDRQRAALEAAAGARILNDQMADTPPAAHPRIRAHSADNQGYRPPPIV